MVLSDLRYIEKLKLEKLFAMGGGYVLNFTNLTFQEFVSDSVSRDIYSGKYNYLSGSKANLLRQFWKVEPNHIVGKVVSDLIELAKGQSSHGNDGSLINECNKIAERLLQGAPVEDLTVISEEVIERDFELLVNSIRASIDNNEPQTGLDRLHTFVTKYLRRLCEKKGIVVPKDKPLHSLMGEYIKRMKTEGAIETEMTERILKSSISNLESFNSVRNDYSLAHDNPILNYEESLLIFNNVTSSIRFIHSLEYKQDTQNEEEDKTVYDDLPF